MTRPQHWHSSLITGDEGDAGNSIIWEGIFYVVCGADLIGVSHAFLLVLLFCCFVVFAHVLPSADISLPH